MKRIFSIISACVILLVIMPGVSSYAQSPTIVINGDTSLADNNAKFPFWLNESMTLAVGVNVNSISVMEFNVINNAGVQTLSFEQVLLVTSLQTVPAGKVWKVEAVALNKNAASSQSGGDNWGGQTVYTDATMKGGGIGSSALGIAQQGATLNQVLHWDGNNWVPSDASAYTDLTLKGNGTSLNPFGIAQQGAATGQVMGWNGSAWVPVTNVAAPADCPSGFTAVNNKYCIETNERTAANLWTANFTCMDNNYMLASWSEWRYACQKGGLNPALVNMTNSAWEWVRDINSADGSYNAAKAWVVGNGSCTASDHPSNSSSSQSNSHSYRCVFYR